jgi:hypothetical protein
MSPQIIQFARLEEFVAEKPPHVVRVTALDVTESTSSKIPGLRLAGIGVHVRTINAEGHVLACYLPVASVRIYEAVPRGSDPTRQEYEAAWEQAEALKERVRAYLRESGCAVSGAGVIHMGDVRPLRGSWPSDPELKAHGGRNGDLRLPQP